MTLRAVVIDDEPPARARLAALLAEVPDVEVVGEAGDGRAGLALCRTCEPDLAFVDVRMPGLDGVGLAHALASLPDPPAVIFTTAFDTHAMDAFDAQAVAYLLKPVRREKLEQAVRRAARFVAAAPGGDDGSDGVAATDALPARAAPARVQLAIRERAGLRFVRIEDVLCFVAEQKYTTVHHAGGVDVIEDSLRALEDEFGVRFLRVHRNALVAADRIVRLERAEEGHHLVHVTGLAQPLAVSRRLIAELRAQLEARGRG